MMIWRRGAVTEVSLPWAGVQELTVALVDPGEGDPTTVRALSYTEMTGVGEVGDAVILTTAALRRRLGTGGYAFVVAFPDRLPPDPPPAPGHIVKARYTPLQTLRLGVDEEESAHHDALKGADDLGGLPVIAADLHSALPAIIAGVRSVRPSAKIAYVMTDGGALPFQFSRSAAELREAGWVHRSITVGQAYGGDYEAVNVYTGLLAAAHVAAADLAIVAQGPGNLGTGTTWGFSGTSTGEALNATNVLGGVAVGSLRVSASDARARHYGISHHSSTVYSRLTHEPITVVVPELAGEFGRLVIEQAGTFTDRHRIAREPVDGLLESLQAAPVRLSTMGRSLAEDPTPFLAAAAAGRWVARELLASE